MAARLCVVCPRPLARARAGSSTISPIDDIVDQGEARRIEELGTGACQKDGPKDGTKLPGGGDRSDRCQEQKRNQDGTKSIHGQHRAALVPAVHEDTRDRTNEQDGDSGCQQHTADGQRRPGLPFGNDRGNPEHQGGAEHKVANVGDRLPTPEQSKVAINEEA
jgi:hypothetical protein